MNCDWFRQDALLVEPAHPKEDDEANQRRFKAEVWREQVELPGGGLEDGGILEELCKFCCLLKG